MFRYQIIKKKIKEKLFLKFLMIFVSEAKTVFYREKEIISLIILLKKLNALRRRFKKVYLYRIKNTNNYRK